MTEADAIQASIWTTAVALALLVVAALWTRGLRRLGARWAPRAVAIAALLLFGALELTVWPGPRPDVGPLVLLWASVAMPLLVVATVTLILLVALTLAVALSGVLRQARRRAPP